MNLRKAFYYYIYILIIGNTLLKAFVYNALQKQIKCINYAL